jgi:hypothetical protein
MSDRPEWFKNKIHINIVSNLNAAIQYAYKAVSPQAAQKNISNGIP